MTVKELRDCLSGLDDGQIVLIDLHSSTYPHGRSVEVQGVIGHRILAHASNKPLDLAQMDTLVKEKPTPDSKLVRGAGA